MRAQAWPFGRLFLQVCVLVRTLLICRRFGDSIFALFCLVACLLPLFVMVRFCFLVAEIFPRLCVRVCVFFLVS